MNLFHTAHMSKTSDLVIKLEQPLYDANLALWDNGVREYFNWTRPYQGLFWLLANLTLPNRGVFKLGLGNETEITFFNREAMEEYKKHPGIKKWE